jgi:hypothetical protein
MVHPKEQEREREREASLFKKEKNTNFQKGKGGGTQREDECPKWSPKSRQRLKSEREENAPKAWIDDEHNTKSLILYLFNFCFGKTLDSFANNPP